MWLLGIELRSSGRAVSALNHQAISLTPMVLVLKITNSRLIIRETQDNQFGEHSSGYVGRHLQVAKSWK